MVERTAADILRVMSDRKLLGEQFPPMPDGTDSWRAWRVWLRALFALPMDDADLAVFHEHTGRTAPPSAPFREAALIVGRRAGKSRVMALLATYLAAFRRYERYLAPGEVATVAVIAADRKQARIVLRYIVGALRSVPMLAGLIEDEAAESVTLRNRVVIEVHTASFRVTRGYTLAAALCDEVAYWRSADTGANPDTEILAALRPALVTIPGSLLVLASSPYAKRGALYDAFKRNHGRDGARVLTWRAATRDMNPTIDPALVAEAMEADPEAGAAEWLGQFRSDVSGYIDRQVVDAAVVPGRFELQPGPARYLAFCDPSGGSADAMTLAIAHAEGERGKETAVVDLLREVRPPFAPSAVVEQFAADLKRYGVREVRGDRYAGQWPAEQFARHGVTYTVAEQVKSDIYRDALPLMNSGRVALLDNARLVSQIAGLERRTNRGGRDSIDHAPGAADDCANVVLGVCVLALSGTSPAAMEERWKALTPYTAQLRRSNIFAPDPDLNEAEAARARVFPRSGGLFPRYRA